MPQYRCPLLVLLTAALAGALPAGATPPTPPRSPASAVAAPLFRFAGQPFVHRWSHAGQHEFTPPAQPDLAAWSDMVTVQLYDKVRTDDQLTFVADGVLVAYQKSGIVVRTSSSQALPGHPAEHVLVAVLSDKGVREIVFARFRLTPEGGQALIYSHRVYGEQPDDAARAWFRENDTAAERAMMAWTDIPSAATLRALPQSPS